MLRKAEHKTAEMLRRNPLRHSRLSPTVPHLGYVDLLS
jgi:hypothetical protein